MLVKDVMYHEVTAKEGESRWSGDYFITYLRAEGVIAIRSRRAPIIKESL